MSNEDSKCSTCDDIGWVWPNLGENCSAGAAVAVSSYQSITRQPYIPCPDCDIRVEKTFSEALHEAVDKIAVECLAESYSRFRRKKLVRLRALRMRWGVLRFFLPYYWRV